MRENKNLIVILVLGLIGLIAVWFSSIKKLISKKKVQKIVNQEGEDYPKEINESRRQYLEYINSQKSVFANELSSIPVVDIELTDYSAPINPPKVEIKFSTITKRTSVPKLFPFVVVDVETTGLDSKEDEIIEISAIKYEEDFTPVSCFTTLLQSHKSISVEARAVNHIDDSMVAGKPYFAEVAGSFSHYIANCNVVGHNLLFDLKFLHSSGTVLPSDKRFFDTLDIAKHTLTSPRSTIWDDYLQEKVPVEDYDVEDYKLETLCDYYKIYRDNAHRSLSDCLATAKLFENLVIARQGESIEN